MFAELPAVVAPEDDDRGLRHLPARLQRVVGVDGAGGQGQDLPLEEWLAFFAELEKAIHNSWPRPKMLVLNYPNSPTGRTAAPGFYEKVLREVANIESCQVNALDVPFRETAQPTLLLQDGVASGFAGCNQFSGSYELDGGALRFSEEMSVTLALCDEPAQGVEDAYLALLSEVDGWISKVDVAPIDDTGWCAILIDEYVADDSPNKFARLVDRLLEDPRYGEKWARHWLDVARYADTYGYQNDRYRAMWPWRDWVIAAFNDNMPLDQFTREQLAGDLLGLEGRQSFAGR